MSREQIENNDTELEKIDVIGLIYELSKALKRFWWRVLLLVIICGGGFYFMAWRSYSPVYEASVSFVVKANQAYSNNYYDNVTAEQLGKTFPYIVTSGVLKDVIAEDLGIGGVPSEIRAEVMDNTNLFTIRVRDASPKRAYDVLQSVVKNYPQVAEYIIGATSLTIVDESGIPERPVNGQSFKRSGAIGVLVGAGISFLFLLLYVSRRKTIRQGEDLKKVTNARFLGNVPEVRVKKRSNRKNQNIDINNKNVSQNFKESIRLIRARIENGLKGKECPVLLVTSALPGEGKTTIAVNLALAFGKKNARVVLIDGDLRNPSVAGVMNLEDVQSGILQVLREKEDPENVFVKVPDMDLKVLRESDQPEIRLE